MYNIIGSLIVAIAFTVVVSIPDDGIRFYVMSEYDQDVVRQKLSHEYKDYENLFNDSQIVAVTMSPYKGNLCLDSVGFVYKKPWGDTPLRAYFYLKDLATGITIETDCFPRDSLLEGYIFLDRRIPLKGIRWCLDTEDECVRTIEGASIGA